MSTTTPQKDFLDKLQSIKSKCDFTEDNFTTLAELECLPTVGQVLGIRTAIKGSQRDIAVEQSKGLEEKEILSSHSQLTKADIEAHDGLLTIIEWLSGNSITQAQAKAILQLAQSKVQLTEDQMAALDVLEINKEQLVNLARYSMTVDAKDLLTVIQLPTSISLAAIKDVIDNKKSSLLPAQQTAIKKVTATDNILKLSAKDVLYLAELDDNIITVEGIKAIQGLVKSFFNDKTYPELTTRNFLACLEEDSTKDISKYKFSKEGLALVVDGVFANKDVADLKTLYNVALNLSPTISSITSTQNGYLKSVSEGPVLTKDQVSLLDDLRTGDGSNSTADDLTTNDVMTLKKIVDAGVNLSTAKNSLASNSTTPGQSLTIGAVTLTGTEVTSTLKASANSNDSPITENGVAAMLRLIPNKAWVDSVHEMKVAGATDANIAQISGFNSNSATDASNYGIVVVDFAQIGTGASAITTDTQIENVRAAYPANNVDSATRMMEIIKVTASDPSPIEVKVKAAVDAAAAFPGATVASVKPAAESAAGIKPSEVLNAVKIIAETEPKATVVWLKIAAAEAFEASATCAIFKNVAELTDNISEGNYPPIEIVSNFNTLSVNEMLQISGNCSLSGDVVNVMIRALGRDDGVKTTCDLKNKDLKDYVLSAQALVAEYPDAEMEDVVGGAFNNGTEAAVNQALGLCDSNYNSNDYEGVFGILAPAVLTRSTKLISFVANVNPNDFGNTTAVQALTNMAQNILQNPVDNELQQLVRVVKNYLSTGLSAETETHVNNFYEYSKLLLNTSITDLAVDNFAKGFLDSIQSSGSFPKLQTFTQSFLRVEPAAATTTAFSATKNVECPVKQLNAIEKCQESDEKCDGVSLILKQAARVAGTAVANSMASDKEFEVEDLEVSNVKIGDQSVSQDKYGKYLENKILHFYIKDINTKDYADENNCLEINSQFKLFKPIGFQGKVGIKIQYDDEFSLLFKNYTVSSNGFYNATNCDNGVVATSNYELQSTEFDLSGNQIDLTLKVGGTGQVDIGFELLSA